jgi:hypothetical protein
LDVGSVTMGKAPHASELYYNGPAS